MSFESSTFLDAIMTLFLLSDILDNDCLAALLNSSTMDYCSFYTSFNATYPAFKYASLSAFSFLTFSAYVFSCMSYVFFTWSKSCVNFALDSLGMRSNNDFCPCLLLSCTCLLIRLYVICSSCLKLSISLIVKFFGFGGSCYFSLFSIESFYSLRFAIVLEIFSF